MALILSIETSTEVCSAALASGGVVFDLEENREGLNHSELLTSFIEILLKRNRLKATQIDAFAVSKGPGSYTGLRIGVSAAKGLCFGAERPLIAVGTLDAMAWHVANHPEESKLETDDKTLFCPMIDARRMEVFCAVYNSKAKNIVPVSAVIIDESFFSDLMEGHRLVIYGNGAAKSRNILNHPNAVFKGPLKISARFMAGLAEQYFNNNHFEDVAYFEPFYLKDFVATIPKNKII